MSNVEAPNINSGDINNPDLLAEQSGTPNMSSSKTFTVDTNMQVNGDLSVTGTVTATSFVGDGSQLTGITGGSTNGGLDEEAVTQLIDEQYIEERLPEPLTPRYPDVSPYYYIYVGEPAVKLNGINDLHYGSDETYDFQYDQEFENLAEAFKFVQESNFDSIAWNDWRNSWVKTRIVFVLQNGKVFGFDDMTHSYISLTHISNHIIFTTQYSVHRDRNNQVDHPNIVGHSYIYYTANFSYCPHVHMGGDIAWDWLQANSSNLIRLWVNSYVHDFHAKYLWAHRGAHVYIDGTAQKVKAEEASYCQLNGIQPCPSLLESNLSTAGINITTSSPSIQSESRSSIDVGSFNSEYGINVNYSAKVAVNTQEDIVIGDGTTSSYSYTAISVRNDSELVLNSLIFNPNDATAMPNLVINTGTLTDPTPEDNDYIRIDWSSKFTRGLPIDTTNAVGVQAIDGWGLVRPDLPELP